MSTKTVSFRDTMTVIQETEVYRSVSEQNICIMNEIENKSRKFYEWILEEPIVKKFDPMLKKVNAVKKVNPLTVAATIASQEVNKKSEVINKKSEEMNGNLESEDEETMSGFKAIMMSSRNTKNTKAILMSSRTTKNTKLFREVTKMDLECEDEHLNCHSPIKKKRSFMTKVGRLIGLKQAPNSDAKNSDATKHYTKKDDFVRRIIFSDVEASR